ncbi:hypothetical protein GRF29_1536g1524455 [Pseudopithomyces chartarum]|uniref:Prenyltransferase alpha-alpha toroid domain-containing protein n=1 Tax=Pseudopithomyces chartarum TaxID=1892770 RepID=A0AAN6RAR7_9PLEO|nr:hypothetical protein GRF29_1536g1524455 [Pseudopithomyces chartarum]
MAPGLPLDAESRLNYAAHIRYWRRNLKTFLPHQYTGNDCNRMTLAAFILSALDILGDLPAALSQEERDGYVDWVYRCQLPGGGFRPAPATDLGTARSEGNQTWDPVHMAGTFFALLILVNLGDDLERVKRREILQWLPKLQRPDGGFGETLGEDDRVEGGNDSRFGFMAMGIRWMLRGNLQGSVEGVPDIDVDAFVECVQVAETYDGGLSEAPYHEAHAGFTSCAISALHLVDRLPTKEPDGRIRGLRNLPKTLHWLAARQTLTLDEEDAADTYKDETDSSVTCHDAHSFMKLRDYPSTGGKLSFMTQPPVHAELKWVGMNGRENKIGDTCYARPQADSALAPRQDAAPGRRVRWVAERRYGIVYNREGEAAPGVPALEAEAISDGRWVSDMKAERACGLMTQQRNAYHLDTPVYVYRVLPRLPLVISSSGWVLHVQRRSRLNMPLPDNPCQKVQRRTALWHVTLHTSPPTSASGFTNAGPSKMPPPSKRRKTAAIAEISFDPSAREEYLTGFHKRKVARQKLAEEENAKKERAEKLRQRAELRKQRKEDLEKHVEEVNRLVKQANGDISEADDDSEDGSDTQEQNDMDGAEETQPPVDSIDQEEEFVDEDKYTTVTIESVGISKHGFEKRGGEDEPEAGQKEKREWTKERPKSNKPKKKKIKFRYETKAERKAERVKLGLKKKKLAAKRKGD